MEADIRHLDPKVRLVWEAPAILTLAILWLVASFTYALAMPDNSALGLSHTAFPFALLLALLIFLGLPLHIWTDMVYQNFTFEFTDRDIVIREGVLTRETTVIPYGRIQDIRTVRTLFERLLHIATLEIETAGSAKAASQTLIPGIADKDKLIGEIMQRVERVKSGDGLALGEELAVRAAQRQDPIEATLLEILKELKTISFKLDKPLNPGPEARKTRPPEAAKKKTSAFDEYERFRQK